jgi:methyl-accepting chemotaxis protein
MTDTANTVNALVTAEAQLREICDRRDQFATPIDTGSLGRMLVHIQNISRSISESTRDHVNASKRLTDFALTLGRMANRSTPASEDLAVRYRSLAEILRNAGAELASAAPAQELDQAS